MQNSVREVVKILARSNVTEKLKEQGYPQRLSAVQQCKKMQEKCISSSWYQDFFYYCNSGKVGIKPRSLGCSGPRR